MTAFVSFPGTSGNYVSTGDVNLLDADSAHLYQTGWVNSYQSINIQHIDEASSLFGGKVTQWESSGAGQVRTPTQNSVAVSPTDVITTAMRIRQISGPWNTTFLMGGQWVQSDGSTPIAFYDGTVSHDLSDGEWHWVVETVTAPALAGFFRLNTLYVGVDAGDVYQIDVAMVLSGTVTGITDATFVPSVRIVGDLDLRARFAATDATPSSAETLIGHRSGNSGFAMTLGTGGELVVYHGTGSGTRQETSSGLSLVAATDTEVRSVIDISAGTWTHYKNGVQFDSSGSFATSAGSPYAGALAVGADSAGTSGNWDGDIYYAEVRDGIDGPVVRRFDADDLIGLL